MIKNKPKKHKYKCKQTKNIPFRLDKSRHPCYTEGVEGACAGS